MFDQNNNKNQPKPMRSLSFILGFIAIFLVYSFATHATEVNLEEPLDPQRQATALRVLRSLARPDFFTYHEQTRSMDITIRMPCGDEIKGSQTSKGDRYRDYRPELCFDDAREYTVYVEQVSGRIPPVFCVGIRRAMWSRPAHSPLSAPMRKGILKSI